MRIATWNVNSLKARMERVEAWLADVAPDVVCLQETKLADDAWPALTFKALGYDSAHHGFNQWNGVAILSRVGIEDVVEGFERMPEALSRLYEGRNIGVQCCRVRPEPDRPEWTRRAHG